MPQKRKKRFFMRVPYPISYKTTDGKLHNVKVIKENARSFRLILEDSTKWIRVNKTSSKLVYPKKETSK